MLQEPMYNPLLSYEENYEHGPFGEFALPGVVAPQGDPQHIFLGQAVHTPFGIPAGPLVNGAFVRAALDKGFDLPVYKTVRTRAVKSHAWPNVLPVRVDGDLPATMQRLIPTAEYGEPLSITNSFGVPSMDPDVWQPDLAAVVKQARVGQAVIGSYQGTLPEAHGADSMEDYIADFRLGARLLKETGVKIVEVNLSCPNEGTSNLLCFDVARSQRVVEVIKAELGAVPLMIKIAYFKDAAALEALVRAVGPVVDAIAAINTISAEIVKQDGSQALPGEGRLYSGVCGTSIKWAGVEMTRRLTRLREELGMKFEVVGVGGVSSVADYDEYGAAGADAVMSATAAMWNPGLAAEIRASQRREVAA